MEEVKAQVLIKHGIRLTEIGRFHKTQDFQPTCKACYKTNGEADDGRKNEEPDSNASLAKAENRGIHVLDEPKTLSEAFVDEGYNRMANRKQRACNEKKEHRPIHDLEEELTDEGRPKKLGIAQIVKPKPIFVEAAGSAEHQGNQNEDKQETAETTQNDTPFKVLKPNVDYLATSYCLYSAQVGKIPS